MSKKDTKEKPKDTIQPIPCPVCGLLTVDAYCIHEAQSGDMAVWFRCGCGVIFQEHLPTHDCYDNYYVQNYLKAKSNADRSIHNARTYIPLIEELTYGRMMLDVGFNTTHNMNYLGDRGWLTWGIDCNKDLKPGGHIYKGSFEDYDFSIKTDNKEVTEWVKEGKIKRTFDLIWMNHVLEHFNDPIKAIQKCYDLLSETGVLYIGVPDIDFIQKLSSQGYCHWNKKEHYVLFSERALKREVEKAGFKVIMSRRNFSSRFISWYDVHLICAKPYF